MKIVGIGGVIIAIVIMFVLSLFCLLCLYISGRYDDENKKK